MSRLAAVLVVTIVAACSSARVGGPEGTTGVTFPARFAEGENDAGAEPAEAPAGDGGSASGAVAVRRPPGNRALPDPTPLRERRQWEYEVVYDGGRISVASVRPRNYAQPVVTARRMGRYAIELWIGHELIERVRFDFPMLAAEEVRTEPRRPLKEPPSLSAAARVIRRVLVPHSERATRAILLDRGTGEAWSLPWPPDAPLGPPRAELSEAERQALRDAGSAGRAVRDAGSADSAETSADAPSSEAGATP